MISFVLVTVVVVSNIQSVSGIVAGTRWPRWRQVEFLLAVVDKVFL